MSSKHILIISGTPSHPVTSGSSSCINAYCDMLKSLGYQISFLWILNHNNGNVDTSLMKEYWKDNLYIYRKKFSQKVYEHLIRRTYFKISGYYTIDVFDPWGLKKFIRKNNLNTKVDAVMVNYVYFSNILRHFFQATKILYTHDIFTRRFQRTKEEIYSLTATSEGKALSRADVVLSIQENETVYYSYLTSKKVLTSYSYFPINPTPFVGNNALLYFGGPNTHNLESLSWFIEEVYKPLLNEGVVLNLLIGGSICNKLAHLEGRDNITLLGKFDDIMDFYQQGDIAINPTYGGSGLKIKSFEAMAYGKVLISHKHCTEGIYDMHNAPILKAQNAEEFKIRIKYALQSKDDIRQMKEQSITYVKNLNTEVKRVFEDAINFNSSSI